MATCNFSLKHNAQFIYAFCDHSDFEKYVEENKDIWDIKDDDELDSYLENDSLYSDWYDQEKEYYLDWLEEELNKLEKKGLYTDFTELRAYNITDGDEVATVSKCINFAGGEFMVRIAIDFEAGYYEGFALDWRIDTIEGTGSYWHSSFDYMPDAEDCATMLQDETELNAGLCKALATKLQARIEATADEVTEAIEQALKTICPYHLTGFCLGNGEGIYTNHREQAA